MRRRSDINMILILFWPQHIWGNVIKLPSGGGGEAPLHSDSQEAHSLKNKNT